MKFNSLQSDKEWVKSSEFRIQIYSNGQVVWIFMLEMCFLMPVSSKEQLKQVKMIEFSFLL